MAPLLGRSNFLKLSLLAVLLICLCLAGLVLLNTSARLDLGFVNNNPLLLPALLLQVFASLLFILAWQVLLSTQKRVRFGFGECGGHIGVTLLGKYLPGKIWGLLGRTFLLGKRGLSNSEAVSLLLADQFLTFYTGIAIGTVALLAVFYWQAAAFTLLLAALSLLPVSRYYSDIINWLLAHFKFVLRKLDKDIDISALIIRRQAFSLSFLVYTIHWLCTAGVLCLLFYPLISAQLFSNSMLIVAAIPLAMLSGFLAVWAPGGIGVREGVIVAILALQLPLDLGATIAISYRLICIVIDLSIGAFALIYFSRNAPTLLQDAD